MSVEHARVVFESDHIICSMGAKDPLEFLHHGLEAGMTLEWRVRRGPQSSGKSLIVKLLPQAEDSLLAQCRSKKLVDHCSRALVAHFLIVSAVSQQELLVVSQERGGCRLALIPDQHAPPSGPQNADEFRAGARQVEPVCRLGGGDEVDGSGTQRRLLGGSR